MNIKTLKACTSVYALFLLLIAGCKRKQQQTYFGQPISEKEITLPLPLIQEVLCDISKETDKSVIEFYSPFSEEYLQRFFKYEMERIGWNCTLDACARDEERFLVFNNKDHYALFILTAATKKDHSRIRLVLSKHAVVFEEELPILRYSPE